MSKTGDTVVVGLGNPIMGDDGVGLAALERLRRQWRLPPAVLPVDGGTWGLRLLPEIEHADAVLLLDAIDAGQAPGALIVLRGHEVPRRLRHALSSHQVAMSEVLALTEVRGTLPTRLTAVGCQPGLVEMSTALSPAVAAGLDAVVAAAVAELRAWGHEPTPAPAGCLKPTGLRGGEGATLEGLHHSRYGDPS